MKKFHWNFRRTILIVPYPKIALSPQAIQTTYKL